MANLEVSKKVFHVGSWSTDAVTDELLSEIAIKARTQKGTKMKLKVNELGMRLTRTKFLQGIKTAFFPIKNMQTVMHSKEFPRCVVFILSDPNKKYKIVALCCETDADAAQLTSVCFDIQNKVKPENVELKKRENGNWTLRGRTDHNANRHLQEVFNEYKQANGEAVVMKPDSGVTHVPVLNAREIHRHKSHGEDVSATHEKSDVRNSVVKKGDDSSDSDNDDYVIETEVSTVPYTSALIHADHEGNTVTEVTRRLEHVSVVDSASEDHEQTYVKRLNNTTATVLPSKPVMYTASSSHATPSQHIAYSSTMPHNVSSHPVAYGTRSSFTTSQPMGYGATPSLATSHSIVYGATSPSLAASQPIVYSTTTARDVPTQPVVYRATSSRAAPPQPVVFSAKRSYNPTLTTTSAGFHTQPWVQRRISQDSSVIPTRLDGSQAYVRFDQQSLMSNTSRLSRSSRMGLSEISIPTTVQRSIENVYPQPIVILRRVHGYNPGYRPRPASYHARPSDLRVYYEEEAERAMLL